MKINRFGKAEVLTPNPINLLFTKGFVKPRDLALFRVCLYITVKEIEKRKPNIIMCKKIS